MSSNEEAAKQVREAIGSHGLWKGRFGHAIRTGKSDDVPEEVEADDRCAFGCWLKTSIDPALRAQPEHTQIVALHAEFHRAAAEVLRAALRERSDVEALLGASSPYAKATAALTQAMVAWERKLSR